MATEAQTCAIGIITILIALHLSRVLYKSNLNYAKQTQFTKCPNEHN